MAALTGPPAPPGASCPPWIGLEPCFATPFVASTKWWKPLPPGPAVSPSLGPRWRRVATTDTNPRAYRHRAGRGVVLDRPGALLRRAVRDRFFSRQQWWYPWRRAHQRYMQIYKTFLALVLVLFLSLSLISETKKYVRFLAISKKKTFLFD
jgi:hypothetical protein